MEQNHYKVNRFFLYCQARDGGNKNADSEVSQNPLCIIKTFLLELNRKPYENKTSFGPQVDIKESD